MTEARHRVGAGLRQWTIYWGCLGGTPEPRLLSESALKPRRYERGREVWAGRASAGPGADQGQVHHRNKNTRAHPPFLNHRRGILRTGRLVVHCSNENPGRKAPDLDVQSREPNPVAAVGLESHRQRTRIVSRADLPWREVGRDGSDSKFGDFTRSALLRFRRLHGFGEHLPPIIHRLWIAHPEPPRKRQEKISRNSNIRAGHAEKNVVKSSR